MVIYDGERLCVQLTKGKDFRVVLDIAKESEYSEYLSNVNIFCLPPTRRNALKLFEAGYPFDESAKIFLNKKIQHEKEMKQQCKQRGEEYIKTIDWIYESDTEWATLYYVVNHLRYYCPNYS